MPDSSFWIFRIPNPQLQALEAYEQRLRLEYEAEKRVKRETISASRNGQIVSHIAIFRMDRPRSSAD